MSYPINRGSFFYSKIIRIQSPNILFDGNTVAWYDYEKLVTKDSNLVSVWGDQSGLGHDLLQSGVARPLWTSDGILFDGINDFMKTVAFTLEQPEFIYMIVKQVAWVSGKYLFDGETQNSGLSTGEMVYDLVVALGIIMNASAVLAACQAKLPSSGDQPSINSWSRCTVS